jgi:hypothetical protein
VGQEQYKSFPTFPDCSFKKMKSTLFTVIGLLAMAANVQAAPHHLMDRRLNKRAAVELYKRAKFSESSEVSASDTREDSASDSVEGEEDEDAVEGEEDEDAAEGEEDED